MVDSRRGLTLLELVLALALSVIIMGVIGMAIHFHLHTLNAGSTEVEQAQLARAVLRLIADDLRSAVAYPSEEIPAAAELIQGSATSGSAADSGSGEPVGGDAPVELEPLQDETESDESTSIAESVVLQTEPGLFGNQYELQLDVSRLPRVDQYQSIVSSELGRQLFDVPSDIKNVAYYLRNEPSVFAEAPSSMPGKSFLEDSGNIGLVRRELDRSITQWAATNNNTQGLEETGKLIAPEITYLEFQYFDGYQWLQEWDSADIGSLPLAVEIVIALAPIDSLHKPTPTSLATNSTLADLSNHLFYRMVVWLPSANRQALLKAAESEGLGL